MTLLHPFIACYRLPSPQNIGHAGMQAIWRGRHAVGQLREAVRQAWQQMYGATFASSRRWRGHACHLAGMPHCLLQSWLLEQRGLAHMTHSQVHLTCRSGNSLADPAFLGVCFFCRPDDPRDVALLTAGLQGLLASPRSQGMKMLDTVPPSKWITLPLHA